jgi:SAM-dependent methyltransferase
MAHPDRHLDLGCGKFPRNPHGRATVCGVDIRALADAEGFEVRAANLAVQPIPYDDASFASVSAYDFLEHVPRILRSADGADTTFPFIRLMNEIWRVLAPGGRLYALTPAYPHPAAFADPTHVNIVTDTTHEYFCGDNPPGRMYGFTGHFRLLRAGRVRIEEHYSAIAGSDENRRTATGARRIAHSMRDTLRRLRGKAAADDLPYLLWEFEAVKPG